VRPPLHEYLRHLIYSDANLATAEVTLRKLKKFPWSDPEFFAYAVKCFVRVWIVNFGAVRNFTSILAGLAGKNDAFGMRVVDAVLEEIYLGMELNRTEHNQRRVCSMRYLAEMFNFRLVNAEVIFTTLYSMLSPQRGYDPPTNYFRCKLICTMLDSCGHLFKSGKHGQTLDTFLTHFQLYFLSKAQPVPFDTETTLYDTLELLRPKLKLFDTLEEASEAVGELQRAAAAAAHQQQGGSGDGTAAVQVVGVEGGPDGPRGQEEEEEEDDDDDSDDSGDDDDAVLDEDAAVGGDEGAAVPAEGAAATDDEDEEDDELVFTGHEEFECVAPVLSSRPPL
jgi:regulator of nonsense transcripts 2